MIQVIGILLAVAGLIFFTYKGVNVYITTILASVVVILTNGVPLWTGLSQGYAMGMAGFVGKYMFIFILGTLLGQVLSDTGYADAIGYRIAKLIGPKNASLGVIVITALLTNIGISGYVVIFTVFPIAKVLYKQARLPKYILPGATGLGVTLGAGILPFSPLMNNIIPTNYLGTNLGAAPLLGIFTFVALFIPGYLYCRHIAKVETARGITDEALLAQYGTPAYDESGLPDWKIALIPMALILVSVLLLTGRMDSTASVCISLLLGIAVAILTSLKRLPHLQKTLKAGIESGAGSIMLTATVIGFGAVVKMAPGFESFVQSVLSINLHPYLTEVIGINLLAGITGSTPGGLELFMSTLGPRFLQMGVNADVLHRLGPVAGLGLNSLPHCATTIVANNYIGVTFKESYKYMFVTTVVLPVIVAFVSAFFAMAVYR